VKNGVPYDVAFSLGEADVAAYSIIFGEMDGQKFNWSCMAWEKRE
jgi:hypothetical protein